MRLSLLLVGAAALLGAAPAPDGARSPRAQAKLDKALAGRIAGATVDCVDVARLSAPSIIDSRTILYRDMSRRIWRNDLPEQCGILRPERIVVLQLQGSQLCRGDAIDILDRGLNVPVGSCRLGGFTPYEKER